MTTAALLGWTLARAALASDGVALAEDPTRGAALEAAAVEGGASDAAVEAAALEAVDVVAPAQGIEVAAVDAAPDAAVEAAAHDAGEGAAAPAAAGDTAADDDAMPVTAGSFPPGPPRAEPERWTLPGDVVAAVRAAAAAPLGRRIEIASRTFLGLPYLNDAAGEGAGIDPDPPSRYDAFDCLTFVEEVVGLALAPDPLYAPAIRDAFRYRGAPAYEARRHFMEAEWIPDAIANGLLADITPYVGRARTLTKQVSLQTWKGWRRRGLFRIPDALLPVGTWSLSYLDLAEVVEAAPRIPAGAILVTLRADRPGVPMVVTHVSLAVPPAEDAPADAPMRMRHATRMGLKKVRDDRLPWYVQHLRNYVNWPALGVTVLMPREQGPRVSALAGTGLPAQPFPPAEGDLPHFAPKPIPPFVPPVAP